MRSSVRKLVLSGLFLALGLIMPFLTGQIPSIGSMLLPMHIPVLICGFVCGWPYGLAVGFITPLLRHWIFGMPPMPNALAMAFELAVYGFCTGLFYKLLPKKNAFIYVSLIISIFRQDRLGHCESDNLRSDRQAVHMADICRRCCSERCSGIILQIVIIPVIIIALKRGNLLKMNDTAVLEKILIEHCSRYPCMQIQDMIKLIYQNEFAGGHLISDRKGSLARLKEEYLSAAARTGRSKADSAGPAVADEDGKDTGAKSKDNAADGLLLKVRVTDCTGSISQSLAAIRSALKL